MSNEREKLIEILSVPIYPHLDADPAEVVADYLIANGVRLETKQATETSEWIPASEPPKEYRDKYGELIPVLVCVKGTEYPFRACYDGKTWGDGFSAIPVTYWMPLPDAPKGE